jgi:DNA (cytosine-5)-methyltransferase 1
MAPSSPSSAAPTRVSGRKRAAKAEQIRQSQEEEGEAPAASSAKRRRGASAGKKPKPPPKQAKPPKAGRKKKEEAERTEPVEDDVCAEEPDEEEMAMGEEEEAEAEEQEATAAAAGSPGKKRVAQPRKRGAVAAGDHEPEFIGEPVPSAEARTKWPKRYDRSAAATRYNLPPYSALSFRSVPDVRFLLCAEQFCSSIVDSSRV